MIKEFLEKQLSKRNDELEAIKARLDEIEKEIKESDDENVQEKASEEIDALKAKKAELEAELAEINAQLADLENPADEGDAGKENKERQALKSKILIMERGKENMNTEEILKQKEERAKNFATTNKMTISNAETRAMLVSSGKIATPTGVKENINELNNEISSIIDMVDVVDCEGMGNNKIPYEYSAPVGGVTVEGETYSEGETVVDFVTTTPQTVTTISYISKQVRKQTPVNYEAKVKKNALNALRKKVSEIVVNKLKTSTLCLAKSIAKLDEKTLRSIALGYGGDENVIGAAVLLLNKQALTNLGDVRGTSEKKAVYEITPDAGNPNTGIIKDAGLSVKYVLNSNLDDNTLIYGQALKFELDLYSNYEINVSEDFKFDKGLLAIRGDVEMDGAVVFKDGFVVATVAGE